ncbi:MAG: NRDE family protein, partial [Ilumatobacteraceae bacterium]
DRPTSPMTRLAGADDDGATDGDGGALTILGGRDDVGGGTWLATNEAGVVAGLTNRPLPDGPDTAKRSRGELPLLLARYSSAAAAVDAFGSTIDPADYNPSWLLVGDRDAVFFVDVTGTERVTVEQRPPGVEVLENRTLHEPSPKVDRVRRLLDPFLGCPPDVLLPRLQILLADHERPPGEPPREASNPRLAAAVRAICVHADEDDYGTRSSAVITVGDAAAPPTMRWTDEAPCRDRWCTSDDLWSRTP